MKKKNMKYSLSVFVFLLFCFGIQITKSYSRVANREYLPLIFKADTRTHYYAQVQKIGTFYGVWATIETSNPAIREPYFSYASINIFDNNGNWIETGWTKSSTSDCIPKFTWATQPGFANFISSPLPNIGVAYQYRIERISPGMDYGIALQAVGEVDSVTRINDMGISGILSMKWKNQISTWPYWNGYDFGVIDNLYNIFGVSPDINNNVQISGNNGNPIPPTAPCP